MRSWRSSRVGDVLTLEYGAALSAADRNGHRYPVFGSNGEVGRNDRALVEGPGIVVGRKGSAGALVWTDSDFWPIDTTYWVKPREIADLRWLFNALHTVGLERLHSSTGVPGLNRTDAYGRELVVPPLEEQRRIAEILDTIDEAIQITERLITKLGIARLALLRNLMMGGMDPSRHKKATSIGEIPQDWECLPISELLADVHPAMRSGPFGSALLASELVDSGVPLLGIDNVQVERFVGDFTRFVSPVKASELARYRVRPGDLMITIMGTVGRCCVVPEEIGEALSSKHTWTLTLNPNLYDPWLACLQINHSDWVRRHFLRDSQGGIMSAIRSETLRSTLLPVPPAEEQREIASVLGTATAKVESSRSELKKLGLLRTGLAADLLSGRVRTVGS